MAGAISQYMHVLLQNERTRDPLVRVILSGTKWSDTQVHVAEY